MGGELIHGGGEGLIRGVELILGGEAYTCVCGGGGGSTGASSDRWVMEQLMVD